jgi:hypothetical protein
MEAASVAIWDGHMVVVAIATTIWGINGVFLIQGQSLSPALQMISSILIWFFIRHRTGRETIAGILDFPGLRFQ